MDGPVSQKGTVLMNDRKNYLKSIEYKGYNQEGLMSLLK